MDGRARIEEIFRRDGQRLWGLLMAVSGRADLAEDALAEAFARALRDASEIRDPAAWVYRVAFRVVQDRLREERRLAPLEGHDVPATPRVSQDAQELMTALSLLPPRQRAVLALHYGEDRSVREIAEVLGISQSSTRVHLFRGRKSLRQVLINEGNEGVASDAR
jgi:RNA polymerase sigma-70 factor (ECF subfamily)